MLRHKLRRASLMRALLATEVGKRGWRAAAPPRSRAAASPGRLLWAGGAGGAGCCADAEGGAEVLAAPCPPGPWPPGPCPPGPWLDAPPAPCALARTPALMAEGTGVEPAVVWLRTRGTHVCMYVCMHVGMYV